MNRSINVRPVSRAQLEANPSRRGSPTAAEARGLLEAASRTTFEGRRMGRLQRLTGRVRAGTYQPAARTLAEEIVGDWEFDARLIQEGRSI